MRAADILLEPVKKYRQSINPPYKRRDLISILGTLFILLAIPLTVFVAVKARPWGPKAAGTAAAPTTIGSVVEPGSMVSEANYIIFIDGSNYYARNGKTGEIQFSGSNDAAPVINAAIAALPSNGGTVALTEGVFNLNSSVLVQKPPYNVGVSLIGAGWRSTFLKRNTNFAAPVVVVGEPDINTHHAWNTHLANFYIDAGGEEYPNANASGMKVYSLEGIFENLYIANFAGHGIHIYGYEGAPSAVNRFTNIVLANQDGDGSGHGQDNDNAGIYSYGSDGGWVMDSFFSKIQFQNVHYGFKGSIANSSIEQCLFDQQFDAAIYMSGEQNVINGNNITNFGYGGAYTGEAIHLKNVNSIIISDNYMMPDPRFNPDRFIYVDGEGVQMSRIRIVDNVFHIKDVDPILGEGIQINPNGAPQGPKVGENLIADNVFHRVTKPIVFVGDPALAGFEIRGNKGFATENSGTATNVSDGGTITHGLAATPTYVQATPSVAGEMVSVTAKNSSTFTVAIKKPNGSSGTPQTIYWRAELK